MLRSISSGVLLTLLAGQIAAAQDFDRGLTAYTRGYFAAALSDLRPLAEKGDARAQHYLAFMYLRGKGLPQSDGEAVVWFRKAAEQGHMKAQYNLAVMYHIGLGAKQNDSEAVKWFRKAANQGHQEAEQNLLFMRTKGRRIVSSDPPPPPRKPARTPKESVSVPAEKKASAVTKPKPPVIAEELARRLAAIEPSAGKAQRPSKPPPDKPILRRMEKEAEAQISKLLPANRSEETPPAPRALKQSSNISGTPADQKKPIEPAISEKEKETVAAIVPVTPTPVLERYHVQLGAVKLKSNAEKEAGRLNKIHKPVLGDLTIVPIRSDLGKRGIFYRLRAGPINGWTAANALCRKLSARKQRCIVANP